MGFWSYWNVLFEKQKAIIPWVNDLSPLLTYHQLSYWYFLLEGRQLIIFWRFNIFDTLEIPLVLWVTDTFFWKDVNLSSFEALIFDPLKYLWSLLTYHHLIYWYFLLEGRRLIIFWRFNIFETLTYLCYFELYRYFLLGGLQLQHLLCFKKALIQIWI